MELLTGKVIPGGCCPWAVYVIFRIGTGLLTAKRKG